MTRWPSKLQASHSHPQNPDTDESQFWRARRPKPRPRPNSDDGFIQDEWPLEDECHNVALLEKLKWLITTADADRPLPILRRPRTPPDIAANLRGFSDEARDSPLPTRLPDDLIPMPPVPALTECYGWTTVRRDAMLFQGPEVQLSDDALDLTLSPTVTPDFHRNAMKTPFLTEQNTVLRTTKSGSDAVHLQPYARFPGRTQTAS